jgi:hypothetical protein
MRIQSALTHVKAEREQLRKERDGGGNGGDTGGHEPPGGNPLEKRVEKLEGVIVDVQLKLIKIDTRLDSMVTRADLVELKADLFKAMNDQAWKFIAAATSMSALFAAIAFGLARLLK